MPRTKTKNYKYHQVRLRSDTEEKLEELRKANIYAADSPGLLVAEIIAECHRNLVLNGTLKEYLDAKCTDS